MFNLLFIEIIWLSVATSSLLFSISLTGLQHRVQVVLSSLRILFHMNPFSLPPVTPPFESLITIFCLVSRKVQLLSEPPLPAIRILELHPISGPFSRSGFTSRPIFSRSIHSWIPRIPPTSLPCFSVRASPLAKTSDQNLHFSAGEPVGRRLPSFFFVPWQPI